MPRVKTADKELAILESASRVFALRPFHEVLIDDVAAEAGIGKGTIYRYFETKEDLYFATILFALDSLAAALARSLPHESSPEKRLERIAREILSYFWERRHLIPMLQHHERDEPRKAQLLKRREPILRLTQEAILNGIERREFRGIDARIGAELFFGMTRAAHLFHRDENTVEQLVSDLMGIYV